MTDRRKLKIGISACLLGVKCRYDGCAKPCPMIYDLLKDKVQFIPVCPEFNAGLGIPRPPMHLESSPRGTRVKVTATGEDKTDVLNDWIQVEVKLMERTDIAAFIFKARSPSCGLREVELFSPGRKRSLGKVGQGLFAAAMKRKFPGMLMVEEGDFPEAAEKLHY